MSSAILPSCNFFGYPAMGNHPLTQTSGTAQRFSSAPRSKPREAPPTGDGALSGKKLVRSRERGGAPVDVKADWARPMQAKSNRPIRYLGKPNLRSKTRLIKTLTHALALGQSGLKYCRTSTSRVALTLTV